MLPNQDLPILEHVMFIDDDMATNFLHGAIATDYRLANELTFHKNPHEALEELSTLNIKQFPELIFVDVNMPYMNGHEFMQQLRFLAGYDKDRTCVTFLTGAYNMRDLMQADENQVDCYYWKPLNKDVLNNILAEPRVSAVSPKVELKRLMN